jgi:hypothetical protein
MNRQPGKWRDRQEVDVTGSLEHRLSQMTMEERINDAQDLAERVRRRLADAGIIIEQPALPVSDREEGKKGNDSRA